MIYYYNITCRQGKLIFKWNMLVTKKEYLLQSILFIQYNSLFTKKKKTVCDSKLHVWYSGLLKYMDERSIFWNSNKNKYFASFLVVNLKKKNSLCFQISSFFFFHQLARLYGGSGVVAQKATAMLDLYDYYIVPVHNPDGYDYAYWVVRI